MAPTITADPWLLAIGNLSHLPRDLRITCGICGMKFESAKPSRHGIKYCSEECRTIASGLNKQRSSAKKKGKVHVPRIFDTGKQQPKNRANSSKHS